jgi:hypothetical protein
MKVAVDWSALHGVRWHQYALRFALAGVVTAAAGEIAKAAGPVFGRPWMPPAPYWDLSAWSVLP